MIHFIDQTSVGNHHMVFNASMVSVLLKMYPDEQITLYGISSNHSSMFEFFSDEKQKRVVRNSIEYTKPVSENIFFKGLNYLRKEKYRKLLINKLLKQASDTDLIFLSITTFTCFHFFVKQKQSYKVPTIACLHGDIDFLYNAKNNLERWNGYVHRKLMSLHPPNFKFLLLNKIAKPILIKDGFLTEEKVMDIEHPYNDLGLKAESLTLSYPIKIAHIGSMEVKRKNSHFIYEIGRKLKNYIESKKLRLQAIGLMTPGMLPYKNELVEDLVGNEQEYRPGYLSRKDYETALLNVHYTIFFYPKNEYIFRASGATVDTISFEKPIFTLKHPYFEYLFKVAGNVGYMFNSLEEMSEKVKQIADNPLQFEAEYKIQCNNLHEFKAQLKIEAIAEDLKKQLGENFRNTIS